MKTIYGLFWTEDESALSTWLETLEEGEAEYDSLRSQRASHLMLFSFQVCDDATDDDITDIVGDLMVGRKHLVDLMDASVLQ